MISLIGIHDRLHGDLIYAKNEIAWGKLTASDLNAIFSILRSLLLPLAGISMLPDIFQSLDDGWKAYHEEVDGSKPQSDWSRFSQSLIDSLNTVSDLVVTGVQHAIFVLEITPPKGPNQWFAKSRTQRDTDVERAANDPIPGDRDFASHLQDKVNIFLGR